MSYGEVLYLGLVIGSFTLFGGVLAVVSVVERRWAKANGKD
jgi:hypothetical protein